MIEIAYYKTENVKLEDLIEFQGNLKELSERNYNKLWKAIKRKFTEPFVVWENKGKLYVLEGHQRLRVLKKKKSEGEEMLETFPANFVKCNDKKEAKRILLELASQYGKVTDDGLYEFAIENEFDGDFLKDNFEFPGMDLDVFNDNFFVEPNFDNVGSEEQPSLDEKTPIICPKCGESFVPK